MDGGRWFKGGNRNGVCLGMTTIYITASSTGRELPAVYKGINFSETHEDDIEIKEARRGTETRSRA
jgi:hypothetical protein